MHNRIMFTEVLGLAVLLVFIRTLLERDPLTMNLHLTVELRQKQQARELLVDQTLQRNHHRDDHKSYDLENLAPALLLDKVIEIGNRLQLCDRRGSDLG